MDLSLDVPQKIQSCLRIFAEHFRCGRQEDTRKFLHYVIDACHNTCLRLKKLRCTASSNGNVANGIGNGTTTMTSTVVKEIFGGALQSQDLRPEYKLFGTIVHSGFSPEYGHYYAYNKMPWVGGIAAMIHLSRFPPCKRYYLKRFTSFCESCNKFVAARKQMSILQAPNVLVIQLKRYFLLPLRLYLVKLWTIGGGFYKGYRMSCKAFLGFFWSFLYEMVLTIFFCMKLY